LPGAVLPADREHARHPRGHGDVAAVPRAQAPAREAVARAVPGLPRGDRAVTAGARPDPSGIGPTTDELLAMAYADGELSVDATRVFESRLARDARLRAFVADQ